MQEQLIPFDGAAQIHLHSQALHRSRVHRWVEYFESAATVLLRAIHREIGAAQEMLWRVIGAPRHCDTDARRGKDLRVANRHRRTQRAL